MSERAFATDLDDAPAKPGERMLGARIVLKALAEQGVDTIFGYPGGAVLPIYDELFQQEKVKHILVRQEGVQASSLLLRGDVVGETLRGGPRSG